MSIVFFVSVFSQQTFLFSIRNFVFPLGINFFQESYLNATYVAVLFIRNVRHH